MVDEAPRGDAGDAPQESKHRHAVAQASSDIQHIEVMIEGERASDGDRERWRRERRCLSLVGQHSDAAHSATRRSR